MMPSGSSSDISMACSVGVFALPRRWPTLRAYLRHRERLLEYAAAHMQPMQKALMLMHVQLHHVVVRDYRGNRDEDHPRHCGRQPRARCVGPPDRDIRRKASVETIQEA